MSGWREIHEKVFGEPALTGKEREVYEETYTFTEEHIGFADTVIVAALDAAADHEREANKNAQVSDQLTRAET